MFVCGCYALLLWGSLHGSLKRGRSALQGASSRERKGAESADRNTSNKSGNFSFMFSDVQVSYSYNVKSVVVRVLDDWWLCGLITTVQV